MSATQLKSLSAHHHSLVDFIIENSHEKGWRAKACVAFRITPAYLSIIWHSDVFREEFYSRLTEFRNQATRELQAAQIEIAKKAYERLSRMLSDDNIDDRLVLDIANSTMKNLGFAPTPGASPHVTKETELTRTQTRELAPGILETARITYRTLTGATQQQLPAPAEQ